MYYSPGTSYNKESLLRTLYEKIRLEAYIWLAIGIAQIFIGIYYPYVWAVAAWNIFISINDLQYSKTIFQTQNGIVARFEPITTLIIALVWNLLMGGIVGVIGCIFSFMTREFVMSNKAAFLDMEYTATPQSIPLADQVVYVSPQDARNGTTVRVSVYGGLKDLNVNIPRNAVSGQTLRLRNVNMRASDGSIYQRDVYLMIQIRGY